MFINWDTVQGDLVVELGDFSHCHVNTLRECCHLPLDVYENGIHTPAANYFYGAVGYVGVVESNYPP